MTSDAAPALDPCQSSWIGARADTGSPIPVAGAWTIVSHPADDCPGGGDLRGIEQADAAPGCPRCGTSVTWQLGHLALAVTTPAPAA